jgi:hypothetical protein
MDLETMPLQKKMVVFLEILKFSFKVIEDAKKDSNYKLDLEAKQTIQALIDWNIYERVYFNLTTEDKSEKDWTNLRKMIWGDLSEYNLHQALNDLFFITESFNLIWEMTKVNETSKSIKQTFDNHRKRA